MTCVEAKGTSTEGHLCPQTQQCGPATPSEIILTGKTEFRLGEIIGREAMLSPYNGLHVCETNPNISISYIYVIDIKNISKCEVTIHTEEGKDNL